MWRLNENLLNDPLVLKDVTQTVRSFQECHVNDCTTLPTQWEALKCVVRGVPIKHGSRLKKMKYAAIQSLLTDVHELEHKHKITKTILRFTRHCLLVLPRFFAC